MAFVTFQSNDWKPEALTIGIIPIAGIIYGIAMAFNESNKTQRKKHAKHTKKVSQGLLNMTAVLAMEI